MHQVIENMKLMRRAMNPFVLTLFEIVKESKPEVVFEIGIRAGQSTRTILAALQENNFGKHKKIILVSFIVVMLRIIQTE